VSYFPFQALLDILFASGNGQLWLEWPERKL